jgi:esterase
MELNYRKLGAGHPLIILHGLYGSGDNWLTIAHALAGICEVILVDQRNHGSSPHSEVLNYKVLAEDLGNLMDDLGLQKATILGHSMGGKAALWFATTNPGRVSSLIIADIGPRSYLNDTGPSNHMNEHKEILAALAAADVSTANTIGEVDQRLETSLPGKRLRQFLLKNLRKTVSGSYEWKINLEAIGNNLNSLAGGLDPDSTIGKSFTNFPVIFIRGEKSPYILEPDVMLIMQLFPTAQIVTIKNAGHWLHAEQPEIFTGIVRRFILH